MKPLIKSSPISGIYTDHSACTAIHDGWSIAEHFGNIANEQNAFKRSSIIVDWSHLIKYSFRGDTSAALLETLFVGTTLLSVNECITGDAFILMKLMDDEFFLIISDISIDDKIKNLDDNQATIINESGAQGCLVLAGPMRQEIWLRSCAMDCGEDAIVLHHCKPLSVHGIRTIFYRGKDFELIITPRDSTAFLFDALIDVGSGSQLTPTGVSVFPVRLA